MDVFEAIHTRQSIGKVRPDPVPRELIERLLAAAAQAPNHHKVRPWRFVVVSGKARERLGALMAENLQRDNPAAAPEMLAAERAKPLRAPVLITVAAEPPNAPKVVEIENVCAAAAASQNILLAAHALGLAGMWRTGTAAYDSGVKTLLGLSPEHHVVGFLYVGYPLAEPAAPNRLGADDRTTWIDA
jgi:nitroreductase